MNFTAGALVSICVMIVFIALTILLWFLRTAVNTFSVSSCFSVTASKSFFLFQT